VFVSTSSPLSRKRIAKTLVSVLVISLLSFVGGVITAPVVNAAPAAGVGLGNGLQMFLKSEAGATSGATSTPFNSGTCYVGNIANVNFSDFSSNTFNGCGTMNGGNREGFTAYIRGYILAPTSETYSFWSSNDDGLYVSINGTQVISNWVETGSGAYGTFNTNSVANTMTLVQGRIYPIEIQFHQNLSGAVLQLYWSYPSCSGCSTKGTAQIIPQSQLGTSSADLGTDCPVGMSEACPANSAMEIKSLTGTNTDGLYWITSAGVSTQVYSLMNSSLGGGGWQLAMKGKSSGSTFNYDSAYWADRNTLNSGSPSRKATSDADAKYSSFYGTFANQMMALFPDYAGGTYGGAYPSAGYGFAWSESITGMSAWTAYNGSTGFGGSSYATNMTNGPQGSGGCRTTPSTLRDMFATSNRCAIRQVQPTPSGTEAYPNGTTASYYAAGSNLFATQKDIRFFGINYGMQSTSANTRARWGFGFNENGGGDETSNDVLGGIGLGGPSITAGTFMGCCSATGGGGQAGVSGNTNGSSTNMAFELYVRESGVQFTNTATLRVAAGTSATLTLTATQSSGSTSLTYYIPQSFAGLTYNSSTGVITASASLASGTYFETATAVDSTGAHATLPLRITVTPAASDTDTALTLSGSQYLTASTEPAFDISDKNTFTLEAWVKPSDSNTTQIIMGKNNQYSLLILNGSYGFNFWPADNATSGNGGLCGSDNVRVGEWQHVAVTRNGTSLKCYINGALYSSFTFTGTGNNTLKTGATRQTFVVGGYSTSDQPFKGQIDQVRVWSSERTLAEILAGMSTYLPASQSNLIAAYGFNGSSNSQIYNDATSATWTTDLTIIGANTSRDDVKVTDTTTAAAYTILKFPRSYLTSAGGWKVPSGVTRATVILVGGGGGGGSGGATNAPAGAGGGGGVTVLNSQTLTPAANVTITVGLGGKAGSGVAAADADSRNGQSTTLVAGSTYVALGGGGGASTGFAGATGGAAVATGGGSGGGSNNCTGASAPYSPSGTPLAGGTASSGYNGSYGVWGWGGSGGGARGAATAGDCNAAQSGIPGAGYYDTVTATEFGRGGNAAGFSTTSAIAGYRSPNNGWGGIISYNGGNSNGTGYRGSAGIIVIRWITASKPIFTSPSLVDTTTALMSYSFRIGGSVVSPLTRNFNWLYSSDSGTTWATVQASTSDSYTISSLDLGVSGNTYQYRVVVTDSDTAGLFIVDTSTAFSLVINPYPTITPPTVISTGQLVNLDAGNASSYSGSGTTWNDLSGGARHANLGIASGGPVVTISGGQTNVTCSAPTYSKTNGGTFTFTGNDSLPRKCAWIPNSRISDVGETYTVEMWVNPRIAPQAFQSALISTPWASGDKINFTIAFDGTYSGSQTNIYAGMYDGSRWFESTRTLIPINSWTHVALVSANLSLTLYVNGVAMTVLTNITAPGGASKGVLIGRRWDAGDTFDGQIGTVKIANFAYSAEQVRQDYYQTSGRFIKTAVASKAVTTTYAVTATETFTVNNGTGPKTFSFTPNNRAGITWDTSTANSAILRISNQLTAGTYYETITATDSVTARTSVPLTIVVNKARQAAVTIGQYNAFPNISSYPINVYGGSSTGAVTRTLTSAGTANCSLTGGMFLFATSSGTCTVQAVKAGDTNYLDETATATIYWFNYVNNFLDNITPTPTTIVLSGSVLEIPHTFDTFTVTSYTNETGTAITSIARNANLLIYMSGIATGDTSTQVTFAGNEATYYGDSGFIVTSTYIQVRVPTGAQSGQVIVDSAKGSAVGPSVTVTG
jgi:Concanavalin A-like lectin/glucanases superfamily/PA14 domain